MTSPSPNLSVGPTIRRYRQQKGDRSVASVAGLCGITPRYLHMIEEGKKVPSVDVLDRIAAVLGVPLAALLAGEPIDHPLTPVSAAPAVARALLGSTREPGLGAVMRRGCGIVSSGPGIPGRPRRTASPRRPATYRG
ncbi:helix-turn-helix domain-containing protein [Streptomyces doebereineriae]|uniref:Helix-turn-helix transcriptional regulator n=1 Tax=Streptomyces doebereineriae TaxID=3075528 RepID=A0ABU2VK64_9ACTN|nr:helix-turn-helix transcriptional regulator [Streptomyces sp. DSM 41640]MDT0485292.1 helix-turn-helix transcriptional regulator [Streptomyces sp. DSM 41640]